MLQEGVEAETDDGVEAETDDGVEAETDDGVEAETDDVVEAETDDDVGSHEGNRDPPGQMLRGQFVIEEENPTLVQALDARGEGLNKLVRESVAALLNAAHPQVNYPFTVSEVISMTQQAIADQDYTVADEFQQYNRVDNPGENCRLL